MAEIPIEYFFDPSQVSSAAQGASAAAAPASSAAAPIAGGIPIAAPLAIAGALYSLFQGHQDTKQRNNAMRDKLEVESANARAKWDYERAMHEYLKEFALGREWFRCAVDDVKAASRHAKIDYHEVRRNIKHNNARWAKRLAAEMLERERISNDNGL